MLTATRHWGRTGVQPERLASKEGILTADYIQLQQTKHYGKIWRTVPEERDWRCASKGGETLEKMFAYANGPNPSNDGIRN